MCSRDNISTFWILFNLGIYRELSELDDEESLRRRAGERDLRRGEDLGDPRGRLPAGDRDLLPDRDLLRRRGDGDLLLGGDLRLGEGERLLGDGDLLPPPNLLLGGDLPPLGGVLDLILLGPDLDLLLGGLLLVLGWTLGTRTGAAVTSCPSI